MTKALYQLNLRLNVTSETTASRSFYSDLSYSKAIAELRGAKYCISTGTDMYTSNVAMVRQPSIGVVLVGYVGGGYDVRLCFVFRVVFYKIKTVVRCFLGIAVDARIQFGHGVGLLGVLDNGKDGSVGVATCGEV